jgi:hypothetical protein
MKKLDVLPRTWIVLSLLGLTPLSAQILYNEAKDKKAQEAQATAKDIASGSLFQKELKNLDALSRVQIDGQIASAQTEYLAALDGFVKWKDVHAKLKEIEDGLKVSAGEINPTDLIERLKKIKKLQEALNTSATSVMVKNPGHSIITSILDNLDKGESVVKFAEILKPSDKNLSKALDTIESILEQTQALYDSFSKAQASVTDVKKQLASLKIPAEQTELELLALEASSLNRQGLILARQELEAGAVMDHILAARAKFIGIPEEDRVEDTLRNSLTDRARLGTLLYGLHEAAAAVVTNTLPGKLAALRRTQEIWRLSIQSSSGAAMAYEQILNGAATRLALYYKGGIKPGQIAQLLYNLSGLVSLPVLAAK